ncbi:protein IL-40 isoform X2 [Erinaceus europaeus]|nr:protein IL-40 isoform X2 [Erinaceus europaeus]
MRFLSLLLSAMLATGGFSTEEKKIAVHLLEDTPEVIIAYKVLEVFSKSRRVLLTCHSPQKPPPVTYSLWGGRDIEVAKKVVRTRAPASFNISITLKSRPDLLTYSCQAAFPTGERKASSTLQMYWELWAKPISQLQAVFTLVDSSSGPRMELSCKVSSGSPPITYSLVGRDGHVHLQQRPAYGLPANFSFPLSHVSNWFQCQAKNNISIQASPLTLVPPGQLPRGPIFVLVGSLATIIAVTSGMLGQTMWTR